MIKMGWIKLTVILIVLGNFEAFAQCLQVYPWAVWNSFSGTNTIGNISMGRKNISVEISTNYLFSSTKRTYNYSLFSALTDIYKIPNSVVPQTSWSDGKFGKTSICFSESVLNPMLLMTSLGSITTPVTLAFSEDYLPLFKGENATFSTKNSLIGNDGIAIIVFPGLHDCITINSATPENYTYLNVGILTPNFPVNIIGSFLGCGSVSLTANGGNIYKWNGGANLNNATNTFKESGIYSVTVTDKHGCSSVGIKSINILPKTTVYSTLSKSICKGHSFLTYNKSGTYIDTLKTLLGCDSVRTLNLEVVDLKIDKFDNLNEICNGKKLEIRPIITPINLPVKYKWSTGDTLSKITISKSGTYQLTINNGLCTSKDSIVISDGLAPTLKGSDTLCVSDSPIVLDSEASGNDLTFFWIPTSSTTKTILTLKSGKFQVNVSSPAGCESTRNFVVVNPPIIELGNNRFLCQGDSLELVPTILGLGSFNYRWSTNETTKNLKVNKAGYYKLTVNQEGCSVFDSIYIFSKSCVKILAPNAFSPNDDGINDIFSIFISNAKAISLQIFDRWGNTIYFDENQNPKWNGRTQETLCLPGIYTFILTYDSPPDFSNKTYQGALMLLY